MTSLSRGIGEVIKLKRLELGLSQESLALLSCLNRTYIGEVERGSVNVSIEVLNRITEALGINLSELIKTYEDHNANTI